MIFFSKHATILRFRLVQFADVSAQNRVHDLVLEAFAEYEERSAVASKS
jgi:hypothetical protein